MQRCKLCGARIKGRRWNGYYCSLGCLLVASERQP